MVSRFVVNFSTVFILSYGTAGKACSKLRAARLEKTVQEVVAKQFCLLVVLGFCGKVAGIWWHSFIIRSPYICLSTYE